MNSTFGIPSRCSHSLFFQEFVKVFFIIDVSLYIVEDFTKRHNVVLIKLLLKLLSRCNNLLLQVFWKCNNKLQHYHLFRKISLLLVVVRHFLKQLQKVLKLYLSVNADLILNFPKVLNNRIKVSYRVKTIVRILALIFLTNC